MNLIENSIGWETEDGQTVAYKKEFAFLNTCRNPKFKTPVFAKSEEGVQNA